MTLRSPLEIEIALHYHYSPLDYHRIVDMSHDEVENETDCVCEAIRKLLAAGYIIRSKESGRLYQGVYEATSVYVEALCNVSLPVNTWVIE